VAAFSPWDRLEAAEKYRSFADGCKKLAQTARTAEHRAVLLHMANEWLRLAEELEQSAAARTRKSGADDSISQ
jgi:hypothetical protein